MHHSINARNSEELSLHTYTHSPYCFYTRLVFHFNQTIQFSHSYVLQDDRLLAECRVRYLSFLGIGQNVKNCAFIMHTAQDKFICHVFMCEPSSGALCKTIEAACKVNMDASKAISIRQVLYFVLPTLQTDFN